MQFSLELAVAKYVELSAKLNGLDVHPRSVLKSLVAEPFERYSCFISYSAKDQQFADLLHSQLRSKDL